MAWPPEQAVMHQQQIGFGGSGKSYRCEACVHGGSKASDLAIVLYLQPVGSTVIIPHLMSAQQAVAVGDDLGQWYVCHGSMEPKGRASAKEVSNNDVLNSA